MAQQNVLVKSKMLSATLMVHCISLTLGGAGSLQAIGGETTPGRFTGRATPGMEMRQHQEEWVDSNTKSDSNTSTRDGGG